MDWEFLLQPEVQQFIATHENDDIRNLALKRSPDASWHYSIIMDQIKVRQKARKKSPDLYETDGIIFPENETYEQASSSACAAYKAGLVDGEIFIDLTAGSGIDAYHIAKNFKSGVLVERDKKCASLLGHNMDVLTKSGMSACDISVHHGDASDYAKKVNHVDFIFVDPQRREKGRKGIFDLSACSPDIISLLPMLATKAKKMMVKTSPVLDIEKAIISLGFVTQVHAVQLAGECKEVLYLLDFDTKMSLDDVIVTAVNIDSTGRVQQKLSYKIADERALCLEHIMPSKYIYEPGAAFQKSGGFKSMAVQFDVYKIHPNSHLYTSDCIQKKFPGKVYEIVDIMPVKSKGLGIKRADLTLRNFPGTVDSLRKKLKLLDGGDYRIFATTLCNGERKLIICNK